jgi:uncharacterized protein YlaI
LHHLAASASPVLDDVPVAVLLAVFEASILAQKHNARQLICVAAKPKDSRSTLHANLRNRPLIRLVLLPRNTQKIAKNAANRERWAKAEKTNNPRPQAPALN